MVTREEFAALKQDVELLRAVITELTHIIYGVCELMHENEKEKEAQDDVC